MEKTVAVGIQDFEKLFTGNCFYIDKTYFIREWWENRQLFEGLSIWKDEKYQKHSMVKR